MVVWRLITHHADPERLLAWSLANDTISMGWSRTGDLSAFKTKDQITITARAAYENEGLRNISRSGSQLLAFRDEMKIEDLVILSTLVRRCVVQVGSDYFYSDDWKQDEDLYGHRRKAELTGLNADELWKQAGGLPAGVSPYWTLLRCPYELAHSFPVPAPR